jgi:PAS domain S-box-containing protein
MRRSTVRTTVVHRRLLAAMRAIRRRTMGPSAPAQGQDFYRDLFRNHHAVMLLVDPINGRILEANPAAAAFYGWSEETLRRMRVFDLNPMEPDDLRDDMRRAEATRQRRFRFRHRRADGSIRDVEVTSGPVRRGGRTLLYSVIHDITEARRLEAEILALNASLEQRVAERTAELRAVNAELESFANAVSHDLRAPLRAMNGFSACLLVELGPRLRSQESGWLHQIIRASERMSGLIDGILQLSRVTRGELRQESVDVSALAEEIRTELESTEPTRRVHWELMPGLRAWADPRLLEAALRNLLGNAWKYSSARPEARISLRGETGRLTVEDNGAGFDMAYAGKLFQPFQRLHRQDEFPGLGLGLATVQRIAHRHGGSVSASAAPGRGARFTLVLPDPPEHHGDS